MGRGWADIYIVKGVSDAFVLTIRELRKLICQSRTKQQETSHGCIVYSPYWLRLHFAFVAKKGYLYTYTYVGLSALLVSTDRAMREPVERGTSDKVRFPRFFVCLSFHRGAGRQIFNLHHDNTKRFKECSP